MTAQRGQDVEMACSFRGAGTPSYSLEIQWWYIRNHLDWTDRQPWTTNEVGWSKESWCEIMNSGVVSVHEHSINQQLLFQASVKGIVMTLMIFLVFFWPSFLTTSIDHRYSYLYNSIAFKLNFYPDLGRSYPNWGIITNLFPLQVSSCHETNISLILTLVLTLLCPGACIPILCL